MVVDTTRKCITIQLPPASDGVQSFRIYRTPHMKSDPAILLSAVYIYPGGQACPTKPSDDQIHIEWGKDGRPEKIWKYKDGNGWLDITAPQQAPRLTGISMRDSAITQDKLADIPTENDLIASLRCECGSGHDKRGQGHSDWCKLYEREF